MRAGPTRGLVALVPGGATPSGRAWLVTFSDLVCLMLTFFVLLYAMSDPDPKRFQALTGGVQGERAPRADGERVPAAPFNAELIERGDAIDIGYLGRVLEARIARYPELGEVVVTRRNGSLVLALPADLIFSPGSATLTDAGRRALHELGGVAANVSNALEVVGHTDPTPTGAQWPSNWELSLARASATAAAIRASGYGRAITVRGQADAHFDQVAPWRPVEERMRLARRVDLVLREHDGGGGR